MKTILFPYKIDQDNKAAYAKAMDMAQRIGATIIFFTVLPNLSPTEKDKAYFHLLKLNGAYQTNHNIWQAIPNVKSKRVFACGNFDSGLNNLLTNTVVDWIVPTTALKKGLSVIHNSSLTLIKTTKSYYPKSVS